MEYWNNGRMGKKKKESNMDLSKSTERIIPSFHYSNIPNRTKPLNSSLLLLVRIFFNPNSEFKRA